MKKRLRVAAVVMAFVLLASSLISGCGKSGPTEEDAQKYVKAVLDLMCTGEYDESVKFADVEEGQELSIRDDLIDEMISSVSEEIELGDEVKARFRDYIISAFAKCKYTVGDAVKTEDGDNTGYDVTVTVEPLMVFAGTEESVEAAVNDLMNNTDELMNMSQEDLYSLIFEAIFDVLYKNLENPQYEEPRDIVVHYGILDEENKVYGVSEEAGAEIGQALFSSAGLE